MKDPLVYEGRMSDRHFDDLEDELFADGSGCADYLGHTAPQTFSVAESTSASASLAEVDDIAHLFDKSQCGELGRGIWDIKDIVIQGEPVPLIGLVGFASSSPSQRCDSYVAIAPERKDEEVTQACHILQEIVQTEKVYVQKLEILAQHWYQNVAQGPSRGPESLSFWT
jgi:hypothetical protein